MKLVQNDVTYWRPELSNISVKATIGAASVIHAGVHIHDDVFIGKNCQIEAGAFLPNGVTLQDNVFIGPHVVFTNDPGLDQTRETFKPVNTMVREGVKIGANSTIKAGVTIGKNALIGAHSFLNKDVPELEKWYGVPAKRGGLPAKRA